jgi:hypothetical protein
MVCIFAEVAGKLPIMHTPIQICCFSAGNDRTSVNGSVVNGLSDVAC